MWEVVGQQPPSCTRAVVVLAAYLEAVAAESLAFVDCDGCLLEFRDECGETDGSDGGTDGGDGGAEGSGTESERAAAKRAPFVLNEWDSVLSLPKPQETWRALVDG